MPVAVDGVEAAEHFGADAFGEVERDVDQAGSGEAAERGFAFEEERFAAFAGGGQRGAKAGHAASANDNVVFAVRWH